MKQIAEEILWEIIEYFLKAFQLFHNEYKKFEEKKEARKGEKLKLEDILSLINHNNFLEMKHNYLFPLKEISKLFKEISNYNVEGLTHYISDIYHEFSILEAELYKMKIDIPYYMELKNEVESKELIEDFQFFFPLRMSHIYRSMKKILKELEKVVLYYKESKIIVRSLFLYGEQIIKEEIYKDGIKGFVKKIYKDGLIEFYGRAALSFYNSGFYELAKTAALKAKESLKKNITSKYDPIWWARLDTIINYKEEELEKK